MKELVKLIGLELDSKEFKDVQEKFNLSKLDIDLQIEELQKEEYFESRADGVEIVAIDGIISTVIVHLEVENGFKKFEGKLGDEEIADLSRENVLNKMKKPLTSGNPVVFDENKAGGFDLFKYNDYQINIQYSVNNSVRLIIIEKLK